MVPCFLEALANRLQRGNLGRHSTLTPTKEKLIILPTNLRPLMFLLKHELAEAQSLLFFTNLFVGRAVLNQIAAEKHVLCIQHHVAKMEHRVAVALVASMSRMGAKHPSQPTATVRWRKQRLECLGFYLQLTLRHVT